MQRGFERTEGVCRKDTGNSERLEFVSHLLLAIRKLILETGYPFLKGHIKAELKPGVYSVSGLLVM